MARLLRRLSFVALMIVAGVGPLLPAPMARADEPTCPIGDLNHCGAGHVSHDGHSVSGLLIIAEAPSVTRASVSAGDGCASCRWTVTPVCKEGIGFEGGECVGLAAGCPAGQRRFEVQLETATEPRHVVSSYCHGGPGDGAVTGAQIAPDVRRYAEQVAVNRPAITTYPPGGVTLVNLPTYFAATAQASKQATVGGEGYRLRIRVSARSFVWSFGDGSSMTTTEAGGPPPGGAVRHTYASDGPEAVTVTVQYGATYSVVTPFGTIGPQVVPGGAVRTLPARSDLQVREAFAGLTR